MSHTRASVQRQVKVMKALLPSAGSTGSGPATRRRARPTLGDFGLGQPPPGRWCLGIGVHASAAPRHRGRASWATVARRRAGAVGRHGLAFTARLFASRTRGDVPALRLTPALALAARRPVGTAAAATALRHWGSAASVLGTAAFGSSVIWPAFCPLRPTAPRRGVDLAFCGAAFAEAAGRQEFPGVIKIN
jgi:hypothetical protein